MLVQFDCFKCIFNQITEMARQSSGDDRVRREMLRSFMEEVLKRAENSTPPEMAASFYEIYRRETGIEDPFAEEKGKSTALALRLFDELAETVARAEDPFESAVRLAIGGNVIDFGATPDFRLSDAAEAIRETADLPLDRVMLEELRRTAERAGTVFYILDNCGEAVIDRLLMEEIGTDKVTLGVRGKAILNDVTRAELEDSGLADLPVLDTGDRAPGVSLRHSSREFLDFMRRADLVIAKGQGNFESLCDAPDNENMFFLFRVKCPVISALTGAAPGTLQIRRGANFADFRR